MSVGFKDFTLVLALALGAPAQSAPAQAAEPPEFLGQGRFIATCDDLGHVCFADTCGRDQIEAALNCRAQCPASVVRSVMPAACIVPDRALRIVLRRRG